jgi:hypothetical protein
MRALRPRIVIGLDADAVAGASVSGSVGAARIRAFARAPLEAGSLVPSALEENVLRPEAVRDALAHVASSLEAGKTPVTLMLPAGIARIVLLEVPAGVAPREFARYRLAPTLPYPAEEAVVEVLPVGGGRVLAAAVRKAALEEYEAVARAASVVQDRMDLAPLAALSTLLSEPRGTALSVDVILGDAAVCLAAYEEGTLARFRTRLRDPDGEALWLGAEVDRTAGGEPPQSPRVRVVGSGASALLRAWSDEGRSAEPGWRAEGRLPVDPVELAWLGGAFA